MTKPRPEFNLQEDMMENHDSNEILVMYKGNDGQLEVDGRTIACGFEAVQQKSGSIFLYCFITDFWQMNFFDNTSTTMIFSGTTHEGKYVEIEGLGGLSSASFSSNPNIPA